MATAETLPTQSVPVDPIAEYRLTRDLRASAKMMGRSEARFLVDLYYNVQDYRIRANNQSHALTESGEPHALIAWSFDMFRHFESDVQGALHTYARNDLLGRWALSIHGIGPVIAAGLLAHIDIEKAPTVGHIWRFAGLDDPANYDWKKGKKRPWNAALKRLCWIIGGSFVRLRHLDNDIYGKVYEARKTLEVERNERGDFAAAAARSLEQKNIKDKDLRATYEAGRLPDGRIDLRARRYAVKLFLSHYHHVGYEIHYKKPPPKPYILEHGGHVHFIGPPNWQPTRTRVPDSLSEPRASRAPTRMSEPKDVRVPGLVSEP